MNSPTGLRRCLATAFLARLADEGMAVAAVLVALHRTGSPAQGAFVLSAWMVPHVAAAPVLGVLAERARRPRLFHACALGGSAVAITALAGLIGRAPVVVTLAVAAAGGSCGPVVSGGLSRLVALLAPPGARRDRAYAGDAAAYNAAAVAGPALVSVVAQVAPAAVAMVLLGGAAAAATALAALLPLGRARRAGADSTASGAVRTRVPTGLATGAVALWRIPELRAITACTCLAFTGLGGLTTTTVLLADHHGRPTAAGLLTTVFALGALTGSLILTRHQLPLTAQRLAALAMLGSGLALGAAALAPSLMACVPLFALAGLCDGPLLSATLRIRAEHAPPEARAQVFMLGAGLKISAAAGGGAIAGVAALPPPLLLLGIAALQLAAAALYPALSATAFRAGR